MAVMYKNLGIINKVEQRNYYGFPIRSASGSIAQFSDGAPEVPIKNARCNLDYSAGGFSALRIGSASKNLCGGDLLLTNCKNYIANGEVDTVNKTFTFLASAQTFTNTGAFTGSLTGKFKENTRYTIILTGKKTSMTSRVLNMRVYYSDSTYDNLSLPEGAEANVKYTFAFVTDSGKTVTSIIKTNNSGTSILYYDECGVFEGVLTAQDFVSWNGVFCHQNFSFGKNKMFSNTIGWTSGIRGENGAWTSSSGSHFTQPIEAKANTTYTISGTLRTSTAQWRIYYLDKNGGWISRTSAISAETQYTFTTPSNCGFVQFQAPATIDYSDVQLEEGDQATTYEPFTYIYGGYYDSETGVLTSTKAADGTDLATPVEYQLQPVEIIQAQGQNNIWCDTGDTLAYYRTFEKALDLLYSSGVAGSETYTAPADGKYLILTFFSANGSGDITLPRTADVEFSKISSGSYPRGIKGAIVDLLAGDVVTIANTIDQWVFNFKAVFRVEGIDATAVVDSVQVLDGTLTSFAPTYTGKILCVAACGGEGFNDFYDKTPATDGVMLWASCIGENAALRISYGDYVPNYQLYGYDGGTALAIALQ